ncbi:hypothetical protein CesoFtcFv8_025705 [Champsocephalus esox]|uniref:Uncharacterized protein n=1 Tax=Champsocephalus esox TaxID=159716 RepID=A0AAN8GDH6_9TELE|nr:hypothetical protein CesoFtcFv8_025705 [Champsocephalus esox]
MSSRSPVFCPCPGLQQAQGTCPHAALSSVPVPGFSRLRGHVLTQPCLLSLSRASAGSGDMSSRGPVLLSLSRASAGSGDMSSRSPVFCPCPGLQQAQGTCPHATLSYCPCSGLQQAQGTCPHVALSSVPVPGFSRLRGHVLTRPCLTVPVPGFSRLRGHVLTQPCLLSLSQASAGSGDMSSHGPVFCPCPGLQQAQGTCPHAALSSVPVPGFSRLRGHVLTRPCLLSLSRASAGSGDMSSRGPVFCPCPGLQQAQGTCPHAALSSVPVPGFSRLRGHAPAQCCVQAVGHSTFPCSLSH